jgi:hypothetical protein
MGEYELVCLSYGVKIPAQVPLGEHLEDIIGIGFYQTK